jgi:hypothetical protein
MDRDYKVDGRRSKKTHGPMSQVPVRTIALRPLYSRVSNNFIQF